MKTSKPLKTQPQYVIGLEIELWDGRLVKIVEDLPRGNLKVLNSDGKLELIHEGAIRTIREV